MPALVTPQRKQEQQRSASPRCPKSNLEPQPLQIQCGFSHRAFISLSLARVHQHPLLPRRHPGLIRGGHHVVAQLDIAARFQLSLFAAEMLAVRAAPLAGLELVQDQPGAVAVLFLAAWVPAPNSLIVRAMPSRLARALAPVKE
jgi:hypothetical protein